MTITTDPTQREAARLRSEEYRDRKRRGVMVVTLEVGRTELHGLERLGLLARGERDQYPVACAVAQFLCAVPAVEQIGAALFPSDDDAA